jgi:hypothetical protein
MKYGLIFPLLALPLLFCVAATQQPLLSPSPDAALKAASGGLDMVRVTPEPQMMQGSVATMCAMLTSPRSAGIHDKHFFDVYVSQADLGPMTSGKGTYPPGTLILKRKYGPADNLGKTTELFTGMRKHEAGYDPSNGNWEYFVTTADGHAVPKTDTMSCISCHQAYESTDYVTRDYAMRPDLTKSPAK